jgi:hypothetical protein
VSTAPENAPDSMTVSASSAVSVPSRLAPVLSLMMTWGAGMPASSSSRRVMTYRTGRLVTRARIAVIGSQSARILPPKPPPHSTGITLIRFSSTCSTSATSERVLNEPWVLEYSVSCPLLSHWASTA